MAVKDFEIDPIANKESGVRAVFLFRSEKPCTMTFCVSFRSVIPTTIPGTEDAATASSIAVNASDSLAFGSYCAARTGTTKNNEATIPSAHHTATGLLRRPDTSHLRPWY